jgi:hypothetical protein
VLSWAFAWSVDRCTKHQAYFVVAALSGSPCCDSPPFRRGYGLASSPNVILYATGRHGCIGAAYLYLTFADLLPGAYVGERSVNNMVYATLVGDLAPGFWFVIIAGEIVPLLLIALPQTRKIWGVVTASILVVSAMGQACAHGSGNGRL